MMDRVPKCRPAPPHSLSREPTRANPLSRGRGRGALKTASRGVPFVSSGHAITTSLAANRNRRARGRRQAPLDGLNAAGIAAAGDDAEVGACLREGCRVDMGLLGRLLEIADPLRALDERVEKETVRALAGLRCRFRSRDPDCGYGFALLAGLLARLRKGDRRRQNHQVCAGRIKAEPAVAKRTMGSTTVTGRDHRHGPAAAPILLPAPVNDGDRRYLPPSLDRSQIQGCSSLDRINVASSLPFAAAFWYHSHALP